MVDFDGASRYAKYNKFEIQDESQKFKLILGTYSGTAGEWLSYKLKLICESWIFLVIDIVAVDWTFLDASFKTSYFSFLEILHFKNWTNLIQNTHIL